MVMLYTISSSKRNSTQVSGPVRAVPTMGSGHAAHLNKETGELCEPDPDSVRDCLPHAWLKAWDRVAASSFTFVSEPPGGTRHHSCYKPLHDSKGRYLTTIYAAPFYTA